MSDIPWFSFISRREQERKEKKYKSQMFPFGDAQKEKELNLLNTLFLGEKNGNELLYQLLCVKECLMAEEPEWRQEELRKWQRGPLVQKLSVAGRMNIMALAMLEQECVSLEEFPDAEQVLARARELAGRVE